MAGKHANQPMAANDVATRRVHL